jgi:hypothetical protein
MDAERQRILGVVHQLERADRMAEAELAGGVDIGGGTNPFFDQPDRLDHQRVQQPIDREADHVLHPDRRLADRVQGFDDRRCRPPSRRYASRPRRSR